MALHQRGRGHHRTFRRVSPDAPVRYPASAVRPDHSPGPVPGLRLGQDAAHLAADQMVAELGGHARGRRAAWPVRRRARRRDLADQHAPPAAPARAAVQRRDARAVRPGRGRGVLSPARPCRLPDGRGIQGDSRGIRRRRGGARRNQSRPYLGHLPARPRQRDAAPRGAGIQPPAAARLRPRLRLPGPGHRLAVADHGVVRGAARPGTAVRRPLGDGTVRRAAACLRRDHERAVPGRRDEGLLHPRPR